MRPVPWLEKSVATSEETVDPAQLLIIGKLVLTFGVLLGFPLLELWLLDRENQDTKDERDR